MTLKTKIWITNVNILPKDLPWIYLKQGHLIETLEEWLCSCCNYNVWEIHRGIYKACMLECQILNGKFWECCIIYAIRTEIYSQCALLNNLRWSLLHRQWLYVKGLPLILLLYNMICRISFLNFSLLHSQPFMHPLVYIKSILLLCTVFRKKNYCF